MAEPTVNKKIEASFNSNKDLGGEIRILAGVLIWIFRVAVGSVIVSTRIVYFLSNFLNIGIKMGSNFFGGMRRRIFAGFSRTCSSRFPSVRRVKAYARQISETTQPIEDRPHRPRRNQYCVPHCCVAKITTHRTIFVIGLRQVGGQDSREDNAVKGAGSPDAGHARRDARDLPYVQDISAQEGTEHPGNKSHRWCFIGGKE